MKVLAIDYGLKNLGFATAETPLATPHSTIKLDSFHQLITESLRIIKSYQPDLIVVGIPEGKIKLEVIKFIQALKPFVKQAIVTHPETLSSQEAVLKLRQARASHTKLQQNHAYAACLILEDYLEMNPHLVKI